MATIFQVFDLKEAARPEAKQEARERRYLDGGFEAPRNSLDVPLEAVDDSRSNLSKPEDIPFGYEYYNPVLAGSIRRSKKSGPPQSVSHGNSPMRQCESKKRAPNVVARLMGLEALPDELPTRKFSQPGTPAFGSPKIGNPGLTRQRSQGAVPSSWQRPPLPRRAPAEERVTPPVLPFRDHPQEEQLQTFKKEFEAKQQAALAKKQEQLRTLQLEDMNRELEQKKEKVRATLDKAKSALSLGEHKRQLNGRGQFEESKEFLDAMKFLQSNKDFIFQFLQPKSEVVGSNQTSNATSPVAYLKKEKQNASSPSSVRKRDGFSPRAFARLFMNPRRWNDSKQKPTTSVVSQSYQPAMIDSCNSSGSRRASTDEMLDDVKLKTSRSANSRSDVCASPSVKVQSKTPRDEVKKRAARDVIEKIKERLRQREQCDRTGEELQTERLQGFLRDSNDIAQKAAENDPQISSFTRTEYLSTGKRVSMHTEDMDDVRYTSDGEELSTPMVTIARENAKRSSISLPGSPHLSARSQDAATSSRVLRGRAIEKPGTATTETPKEVKKATILASESLRRHGSQQARRSLISNSEAERNLRKSASGNEDASRSRTLKQKVDASGARHLDQSKEPASNLTRCRSIPNVALQRKREQCSSEAMQTIRGERQSEKFKGTTKTIEETPKHVLGQKAEKTEGFFSGGRKKARNVSEGMPSAQHLLFPSSTPVLERFAALAESCISHSKTLSDADSAMDVKLHDRTSRNAGSQNLKKNPSISQRRAYPRFDRFLGEPSPAEAESVVSESSADSDTGSCEDEFFKNFSQLPPLAKSTSAESRIAGESLPSTVPKAQQQVQNFKTSSKPPTAWTTATQNIQNKTDDEQDSNSDNNGQPSPVSVLEAQFEEESSCIEFKETANGLQGCYSWPSLSPQKCMIHAGMQIQSSHLRFERPKKDSEHVADTPRVAMRQQFLDSARENQILTTISQHKTKPLRQFATTQSPNLSCPEGQQTDLAFVSKVLVVSDFITHGGSHISKWHSSIQPITPRLFQNNFEDKKQSAHRRILFDSINEILVEKLRPKCYEPWTLLSNTSTVRTGRRLVMEIWNEIHKRQCPANCNDLHDDYLESLVEQDLQRNAWMSLHHDVNGICLQLEKLIFDDLIKEVWLV